MAMKLVKEGDASRFWLRVFCGVLVIFIGSCAQGGDGSSSQERQKEITAPAGTRTVKQMEEYEKTHPPSKEQRVMPMPGFVPGQTIGGQPHSGSKATGQ